MKRGRLLAMAALSVATIASACGPSRPARLSGYERYVDGGGEVAYRRALRRWTRDIRLYDRWSTSLLMKATYKSPAFRRAWSHEYARRYILPQEDAALLMEAELDEASRFHEFQFAAWADDSRGGDFVGKDPPWKVRMIGDGGRSVEPLLLRRVRSPSTEILRLYDYITPHDRVFIAKFPVLGPDGLPLITDRSEEVRLQVAGVVHRGDLIWKLHGP